MLPDAVHRTAALSRGCRIRRTCCGALALLLAACSSSPTGSGGTPTAAECASRVNDTEAKLVACIQQDALWAHMQALQQIADDNPGPDGHASRNSGEPGYLASVNYAADLLRAAGYRVTVQPYTFVYNGFAAPPVFTENSPTARTFTVGPDWAVPLYAGGGDVTAQVQPVGGILIPAPATPASTSGCTSADFSGFVPGRIALIQRGSCAYGVQAQNAVTAGASGVIIFDEGNPDRTSSGYCGSFDPGVPVVCLASYAVGDTLYQEANAGPTTVHISVGFVHDPTRADYNLIADSPYGDSNRVVVVDAHLDAIFGAGMLDNASGSATILEIALKMAKTHTHNQLRFIWFGGEELGLLGSFYYTQHLSASDLARIVFDVDADVTATPNYVYAIADPGNSSGRQNFPPNVVPDSKVGNDDFAHYFTNAGLPYESRSSDGTDSYAFGLVGVPNTGVLTGQDCCKSPSEVSVFGGSAGNFEGNVPGFDGGFVDRPFLWGDNLDNNDPAVLETVSKAVASVVFELANDGSL
jgi:Zn-dependent M28 family amino/carboxypeptidase